MTHVNKCGCCTTRIPVSDYWGSVDICGCRTGSIWGHGFGFGGMGMSMGCHHGDFIGSVLNGFGSVFGMFAGSWFARTLGNVFGNVFGCGGWFGGGAGYGNYGVYGGGNQYGYTNIDNNRTTVRSNSSTGGSTPAKGAEGTGEETNPVKGNTTVYENGMSADDTELLKNAGITKEQYDELKEIGLSKETIIECVKLGITEFNQLKLLKDINLGEKDLNRYKNMTETDIKGLNQTTAKAILGGTIYIGSAADDSGKEVGKLSNDFKVLLLLQKSGIDVEVEHNPSNNVKDHWVRGPITNVQKDDSGRISYDVDCTNTGLEIKGKYTITQDTAGGTVYHAKKAAGSTAQGSVEEKTNLHFEEEGNPLKNKSGKALVHKN